MKSLNQLSEEIGNREAYFRTMKYQNKNIYRFYTLHGKGDIVKGYHMYNDYKRSIQKKLEDLYFSYDNTREFFSHFPKDKRERKNLRQNCDKILVSQTLTLGAIKKAKQILRIEAYRERLKQINVK